MAGTGYFSAADLLSIWQSSVDPLYAQPFLDAGDGGGLEAFNQALAQLERVSKAINAASQALFILPSSAQTADPASGEQRAVVGLVFTRTRAFEVPVVLTAGSVMVEELVGDWGVDGAVPVLTGRHYALLSTVALLPGSPGPVAVGAAAEAPGWGYNNPEPGSLSVITQPAEPLGNARASVAGHMGGDRLYAANEYLTFVAGHVGQYVLLDAGSNSGKIRRAVGYTPPSLTPIANGGSLTLAQDIVIKVGVGAAYVDGEAVTDLPTGATGVLLCYDSATGVAVVQRTVGYFATRADSLVGGASGASTPIASIDTVGMLEALDLTGATVGVMWLVGETLTQAATGAVGTYLGADGPWARVRVTSGWFSHGNPIVGATSAVTITPVNTGVDPMLLDELHTASWKVLDWVGDLGVVVANPLSPTGGKLGVLDELGMERQIPRNTGESDLDYRRRVAQLPDTVSPNAIRRACSRVFTPIGATCEFREVGTYDLPGLFYDVPSTDAPGYASAYDVDPATLPNDRYKMDFDYADFRAYFMVGVPKSGLGEFGIAYDAHPLGFYDIGPALSFYDGFPATEAAMNKRLWNDVATRKAAGVGFDFYQP